MHWHINNSAIKHFNDKNIFFTFNLFTVQNRFIYTTENQIDI